MNIWDYAVILIIIVCFYFAIRHIRRCKKNGNMCMGCSQCKNCESCKRTKKEDKHNNL